MAFYFSYLNEKIDPISTSDYSSCCSEFLTWK